MHHHVRQHPWLPGDESHAVNGPRILELLRETGRRWLVIHGHQHLPSLTYGSADPNAPVIFSAGSVAAKTYSVRGRTPRNQMYLVEFDEAAAQRDPPVMRGKLLAWNWTPAIGWTEACRDSGLPRECGFGETANLTILADRIVAAVDGSVVRQLRWPQLAVIVPEIQFLIPDEMDELVQILERRDLTVDYDRCQVPSVFARKH